MEDSIAGLLRGRWRARVPFYRSLLAEAYLGVGEMGSAEKTLRAVFTEIGIRQERWWHPDLLRVAGNLEAASGRPRVAMRYLKKSLDCARTIGAGAADTRTRRAMTMIAA